MDPAYRQNMEQLVKSALIEDLGMSGDITTRAIDSSQAKRQAVIIAKAGGIMCGGEVARQVFLAVDPALQVDVLVQDGETISEGNTLIRLNGAAPSILTAERTALNFLGRLCAISTLTSRYVAAVAGLPVKILDTRKTLPGWRLLEKDAVVRGGGLNHRMGLFDMFLIKENHIAAAGSIPAAVYACLEYSKKHSIVAQIEVETRTLDEVKKTLALPVNRIMLDNMSLAQMKECVAFVKGRLPLEASGNVTLKNVRRIAETGVDYISVGAITHSAPNFDLSLLVKNP